MIYFITFWRLKLQKKRIKIHVQVKHLQRNPRQL